MLHYILFLQSVDVGGIRVGQNTLNVVCKSNALNDKWMYNLQEFEAEHGCL